MSLEPRSEVRAGTEKSECWWKMDEITLRQCMKRGGGIACNSWGSQFLIRSQEKQNCKEDMERIFRVIEAQPEESHSTTELKCPYKSSHYKDHVERWIYAYKWKQQNTKQYAFMILQIIRKTEKNYNIMTSWIPFQ